MITLDQIKDLRAATGVAIQSCKEALEQASGDMDQAIMILRKKGEAKSAARADRTAGQGVVTVMTSGNKASMVELRCETDFVARGDDFQNTAKDLVQKEIKGEITDDPVELKDLGLKTGEKIELANHASIEGEVLGTYVHSNNKIGVILAMEGGSEDLARDITMHIAAMNPKYISPDEVTESDLAPERELWEDDLKKSGKPEDMWSKIKEGKEKKFREENALLKQNFVKDQSKKVEDVLGGAKILKFLRFSI